METQDFNQFKKLQEELNNGVLESKFKELNIIEEHLSGLYIDFESAVEEIGKLYPTELKIGIDQTGVECYELDCKTPRGWVIVNLCSYYGGDDIFEMFVDNLNLLLDKLILKIT